MTTLYPVQDTFVRGEISPRLHARASLDLYRAALSKCENFVTLPHGGIRKRGGTVFVGEVKDSARTTRGIPFIFSSEQAYCLEFGDLYIRVYAYGARVGTVEIASPYMEADLFDLAYVQSADQMWISHKDYPLKVLTRTAHTTWTLKDYEFEDGPYDPINDTSTTLTPADYGSLTPLMTGLASPSGTVTSTGGAADAWEAFDKDVGTDVEFSGITSGIIRYRLPGGAQAIVDAYYVTATDSTNVGRQPASWKIEGSNDGFTWTALDSQTGQSGWTGGETRYYEFFNKAAFEYHQFHWLGVNGQGAS